MSIIYSKSLREFKKPTFKIGDRVRISKYDLLFCNGYKPEFTREFSKLLQLQQGNHQHTQSKMSKTRLFEVNFTKKS